jgi:methionyl-tRNA formyltransferase
MRVLFLGNNWLGWQVLRWLKEQGEQIVGLAVHPDAKAKYRDELVAAAGLPPAAVLPAEALGEARAAAAIEALRPDIGVSVMLDYLVPAALLAKFPRGVINLHPSLLPYNRGQYPNVWSIVERTPAGASLHYMNDGVDAGDLIAQREVRVEPVDTGETLYRKLEQAGLALFQQAWPAVMAGRAPRMPQRHETATTHRRRDVERIDEIDLERTYRAKDLIDILRARTFPPHTGAYFIDGGRKVYLRLQLEYGADGG